MAVRTVNDNFRDCQVGQIGAGLGDSFPGWTITQGGRLVGTLAWCLAKPGLAS